MCASLRATKSHSAVFYFWVGKNFFFFVFDTVIDLQLFWSGKTVVFIISDIFPSLSSPVMSIMAQGAHRGRPVAAAPLYSRALAAKIATSWCLRLIPAGFGSGRGSVRANTALSPHPCGLPRPSGNVSAILRPPTPAVSASMVNKIKAAPNLCKTLQKKNQKPTTQIGFPHFSPSTKKPP